MYRTPPKSVQDTEGDSLAAGTAVESEEPPRPNVRRSIGEWESDKPDNQGASSSANKASSPELKPAAARRLPKEAPGKPSEGPNKSSDRLKEARSCLLTAKMRLGQSGNLKTDIKVAVTQAVERLYQLVKEAESSKGRAATTEDRQMENVTGEEGRKEDKALERTLQQHMTMMTQHMHKMKLLNEALTGGTSVGGREEANENVERLLGEVRELRQTSEETRQAVSSLKEAVPSYAEVLARPNSATSPTKLCPKHSIIVSSGDDLDTSEVVLGKVRNALEAKTTGLRVTRAQKVRNQKVVLSCDSKEELQKVRDKIAAKESNLIVEAAQNKDPLVMIKNLLSVHKDEEIVACLKSQNATLLKDLQEEEIRAVVRYRRRARNPHENHVVIQVSPKLWQRLTQAKRMYIDLQYVVVQDQSPLVQCTRCLGYGHGRKLCTEPADLCSYCAGPHLRADCPAHVTGESATCRNCRLAKHADISHNAFDGECPVRKRWDAIARSSVAYC